MYDINQVRADFPILSRKVYDKPLVYLDNAATTQKPLCVLDAMRDEYLNVNANVHRGVHYLSQQATDLHEAARETVRKFINAPKVEEVIFTRGTTESLNLVVSSFSDAFMSEGDEVIISTMEHHSNIVPWQLQAAKKGIAIRVIPINDKGEINLDEFANLFTERTKIVSIAQVSNVLGTVNPVKEMIKIAHEHGVPVMVDGAQSTPHFAVDVQDMDCDFFAFSGHKIYGPTGIGVLYGKEEWLEKLPPYQGGGEMIESVSFEKTTFEKLPFKFEAGTPDYVATHGLAKAIDYVSALGMDNIAKHEQELTRYCMDQMRTIDGIRLFGEQEGKDAVVSWFDVMDEIPAVLSYGVNHSFSSVYTGLSYSPTFFKIWRPSWHVWIRKQWLSYNGMEYGRPQAGLQWKNLVVLPRQWYIVLNASGNLKGHSNTYMAQSSINVGKSIQKNMKNLWVKLAASNLFNAKEKGYSEYNGVYTSHWVDNRQPSISLTISYSFNPAKSKYKGKTAGEDELRRL